MYLSSFRLIRYTTGFPLMHGLLFNQSVSFTFQSPNLRIPSSETVPDKPVSTLHRISGQAAFMCCFM